MDKLMTKASRTFIAIMLMAFVGTFLFIAPNVQAEEEEEKKAGIEEIFLVVGELKTLAIPSLTRVSVTDPDIADIAEVDDTGMLLIGKTIGETSLFYWDSSGKHNAVIYVYKQDLSAVKARIETLLKAAKIDQLNLAMNEAEGKIVISGDLREYQEETYEKIIEPFGDIVIDISAGEEIEDLIQIDMQITELTTTLTKELGVNWFTGTQTLNANGQVTTDVSGTTFQPTYGELLPDGDSLRGVENFFNVGKFARGAESAFVAQINALITEGKGRILSKPKLVVVSGEEATFLVGGEIPFRTTTVSGDVTVGNVEFKEYGVGMTVTPTVKRDKIDILLNVELSEVDTSSVAALVGEGDVAFTTKTAQTRLYLNDRETVVLAGLIKSNKTESVRKVPYLNRIPVLGLLFRSKTNTPGDRDEEIVINLTPTLLNKDKKKSKMTKMAKKPVKKPRRTKYDYYNMRHGGEYASVPQEMVDYVQNVQRQISGHIHYPSDAVENGWEGTVKLGLLILSDGTLAFATVKESSGYPVFDDQALRTAKTVAAPFNQFPPNTELQELDVTIPIVYSLSGQ